MNGKEAYSYTVLRYVHDVVSGEALNVGIVMRVSASRFVKAQTNKTIGRLRRAFPDLDRQAFVSAMHAVDRSFRAVANRVTAELPLDGERDARSIALAVLPDDDSALQWSPPGAGLTDDPERTFDELYERYVTRYVTGTPGRRTDDEVWRPVRDGLAARGIDIPFGPKTVAGAHDRIEFRRAW